jgi:hypothetical protein
LPRMEDLRCTQRPLSFNYTTDQQRPHELIDGM